VRDEDDAAAGRDFRLDGVERSIKVWLVKTSEALVEEEGVEADARSPGDLGDSKGQRQRCLELFASGESGGSAFDSTYLVADLQPRAESVPTVRHLGQRFRCDID
jgi:hypothetical protein